MLFPFVISLLFSFVILAFMCSFEVLLVVCAKLSKKPLKSIKMVTALFLMFGSHKEFLQGWTELRVMTAIDA